MYLHKGHLSLRRKLLVHPHQRQSCHRPYGFKHAAVAVSHEVAHLATIGHAGKESVGRTKFVFALQMAHEAAQVVDIVDLPPFLHGVAHVPTAHTSRVFQSLRHTQGKALGARYAVHAGHRVDVAIITMQQHHQRRVAVGVAWQHKAVAAHIAIYLYRVHSLNRSALGLCRHRHDSQQHEERQ